MLYFIISLLFALVNVASSSSQNRIGCVLCTPDNNQACLPCSSAKEITTIQVVLSSHIVRLRSVLLFPFITLVPSVAEENVPSQHKLLA